MNRLLCLIILSLSLCIFVDTKAFAQDKPKVIWGHTAINGMKNRSDMLVDEEVLSVVAETVDIKLKELSANGELPFIIKDTDNSFTEDIGVDGEITLIPLVMDDHCFMSEYKILDKSFYKAVLMSQIDIILCYYPGTGDRLRILNVVPLVGYSEIGENGECTEPITKETLKQEFIKNVKVLINQEMKFANKKIFKDLDLKTVTPDTYQVTSVTVSSEAAQKFYGEEINIVKALIGSSYTSALADSNPELTILPSVEGGNWEENAAKQTYVLSLGDTGKYLALEKGANEINLDLTKIASFNIPLKRDVGIYKKIGFAAELNNVTNGKFYRGLTERTYLANNSNIVKYDLRGIMAQLLTDTAKNLAQSEEIKR